VTIEHRAMSVAYMSSMTCKRLTDDTSSPSQLYRRVGRYLAHHVAGIVLLDSLTWSREETDAKPPISMPDHPNNRANHHEYYIPITQSAYMHNQK